LVTAYQSAKNSANMQAVFAYLYALAQLVDGFIKAGSDLKNAALKSDIGSTIGAVLKPAYTTLIALEKEADGKLTVELIPCNGHHSVTPSATQWGDIFGASSPVLQLQCSASSRYRYQSTGMQHWQAFNKAYTVIASAITGVVTVLPAIE